MEYAKLFESIDALREEYVQVLLDVCSIESPTESKAGVDAVGRYFIERAKRHGWRVDVHREEISGDVVAITMNADAPGAPIALSGHTDTVHPIGSFGTPPARVEGERLYGPGATDCKGGIVAAFLAMDALERCGFRERPVMLLLQSDEENSSRNSKKRTIGYICEMARNAAAFLNCEGHNRGYVCLERKGILKYQFRVLGKAVHASTCGEGISAIAEAAHKILALEQLRDGGEWGVTCNCGLIRGGSAENSVPAECVFTADIRVTNEEDSLAAREYVRRVAETSYIAGSSCEVVLKSYRVPMVLTERNLELLARINEIYSAVGLPEMRHRKSSGGSDAADVTEYGIPCVDSIGVTGEFIHSVNEYMEIPSLSEAAKRIAAIAAYL